MLFFGTKFYLYISGRESHDKRPPNNKVKKKIKNDYINNYVVRCMYYRVCDIPNT